MNNYDTVFNKGFGKLAGLLVSGGIIAGAFVGWVLFCILH
jgi:hypothetical protein